MFHKFARWMSNQRQRKLPIRLRTWFSAFNPSIEPLETRLVLSSGSIYWPENYLDYPIIETSGSSPNYHLTIYEDLTGDGLTPDDVPVPFQIHVLTYRDVDYSIRYGTEVDPTPMNDGGVTVIGDELIANGGVVSGSHTKLLWRDLDSNGYLQAHHVYYGDNTEDPDELLSKKTVYSNPDTSAGGVPTAVFPAGQTWVHTDTQFDADGNESVAYVRVYTVQGSAYEDLNLNGSRDAGEPGIQAAVFADTNHNGIWDEPDRNVRVGTTNDFFFNRVITNSDGTFHGQIIGRGNIGFGYPQGQSLTPLQGRGQYVAPGPNDPDNLLDNVVFGVARKGQVQGRVFNDPDADGVWHPARGEEALTGVTVTVTQNGKTYTTVTIQDGYFSLYVDPGPYRVSQDLSGVGITQTTPANPNGYTGTFTASGQVSPLYQFGRIQGKDIALTAATRADAKGVDFSYQTADITSSFTVSVYRSADVIWDAADVELASAAPITPGAGIQTGSGRIVFPTDYVHNADFPYLIVVADSQKKIGESNENNNARVVQRLIDLTPFQVLGDFTYDAVHDQFVSDGAAQVGFKPVDPEAFVPLIGGKVTYNQDEIRIAGQLTSAYGTAAVPLFDGSLKLNIHSGGTAGFTTSFSLYELVGAKFDIQKIELVNPSGGSALDSYLSIEGILTAPPGLGGFQVELADPNYIHLGPMAHGISATIPLGDASVSLGSVITLEANGAAISYLSATESNPDGAFRLHGKFTFKNKQLKSNEDLAPALDITAPNYVEFGKNGEFYVGKFTINNLTLLPTFLSLKSGTLFLDTVHREWKVDGELLMRPLTETTLLVGAGMYEDDFNYFSVGLANLDVPTLMAGIFLNKISLSADNLAAKKKDAAGAIIPIEVSASIGLSEGPAISIIPIPLLDISAHETHIATMEFTGTGSREHVGGSVQFVYMDPKLVTLTGSFDWNWKKSEFKLTGGVNAFNNSLVGQATVTVNQRGMIASGQVSGTLKLPDVGGIKIPAIASAVLRGYWVWSNIGSNNYLALSTEVTLPVIGRKTVAVRVSPTGEITFYMDTMISLENIQAQSVAPNARSFAPFAEEESAADASAVSSTNTFQVATGTQQLLLSATWANPLEDATLEIVRPDGTILTEAELDGQNSALIPLMTSTTSRAIALLNPMEGEWQIHVVSASDTGDTQYAALRDGTQPTVQVLDAQVSRDEVTIHYTASAMDPDSKVTLFYDTDNQGFDGLAITDNLPVTGATSSATWDLSHSFSGTYYLYAALTNSHGGVYFQYLDSPVTIDADPPTSTVDALPDITHAANFTLSWSGADDANGSGVAFYDIYVSDNGGAYTQYLHNTTHTTAQFTGAFGHTYAFYSVATDAAGRTEDAPTTADAQTTTEAPGNHSPTVLDALFSLAENSSLNTPVGALSATDTDAGDTLTFSITAGNTSGAFQIDSTTGAITVANPAALDFEATPQFTLTVQVADNHGAIDTATVQVNLTDVNDAPQLTLGGAEITWTKKQPAVAPLPLVTVTGATLQGGTLTISINAPGKKKPLDLLTLPSSAVLGTTTGPQFAHGQLTLQIHLGNSATATAIQTFLRGLKFTTKGAGLKALTRTLTVTLANATTQSSTLTQTLHIAKK